MRFSVPTQIDFRRLKINLREIATHNYIIIITIIHIVAVQMAPPPPCGAQAQTSPVSTQYQRVSTGIN